MAVLPGYGQTFQDIETYGARRWLEELAKELQAKTYQPSPVKRVWIPKPDGQQRPLGIPTIRDRVVQMATVLVLEPIFEADLAPEQYAYRPGKGALDAHIVNYADDFVICTRGHADEAMSTMRAMMGKLKLTVNEKKTRRIQLPDDTFTFLGYTLSRQYSRRTGEAYLGLRPAVKKIRKLCREISELTDRRTCLREVSEKVAYLNQKLNGWANYFCLGPVVRVYEVVMKHIRRRLRRWLCAKHKVRNREYARYPNEYLHDQLHLVQLGVKGHRLLWAKA